MPVVRSGREIIVFPPELSRSETNELLVLAGEVPGPPNVVSLGVHLPADVVDTIIERGGSVQIRRGPSVDTDGNLFVPDEMKHLSESIPGIPTEMDCRSVLNVSPDAAPNHNYRELGNDYDGSIERKGIGKYPQPRLICDRLRRAADRYLLPDSPCHGVLQAVNIYWRVLPAQEFSIADTQGHSISVHEGTDNEPYECWRQIQTLLKKAEKEGIKVNIEVKRLTRFS